LSLLSRMLGMSTHKTAQLNGTKLGSYDLWEEENQICLNEVDPLRSLLLNKYNTYCPYNFQIYCKGNKTFLVYQLVFLKVNIFFPKMNSPFE
jgi:hypothetical protein